MSLPTNWGGPPPEQPKSSWSKLTSNQQALIILGGIGALLLIIVIAVAITSSNENGGPDLRPGNASATQVCGLLVNTTVGEGAEAGQTIETSTTREGPAGPDAVGDTYGLGTAGQNEIKTCQITLSDGSYLNAQVTLFPNGTWGWHDES